MSPHEFLQQVMAASAKKFTIEKKADPLEFLSWLLNTIHADLTGGKRKKPSIISKCFQASHSCSLAPLHPGPDWSARALLPLHSPLVEQTDICELLQIAPGDACTLLKPDAQGRCLLHFLGGHTR